MKYELFNILITTGATLVAVTLYAARQEKKLDVLSVKLDELAKGLEMNRLEDIEKKKDWEIQFDNYSTLINNLTIYVNAIAVKLGEKPFMFIR